MLKGVRGKMLQELDGFDGQYVLISSKVQIFKHKMSVD